MNRLEEDVPRLVPLQPTQAYYLSTLARLRHVRTGRADGGRLTPELATRMFDDQLGYTTGYARRIGNVIRDGGPEHLSIRMAAKTFLEDAEGKCG